MLKWGQSPRLHAKPAIFIFDVREGTPPIAQLMAHSPDRTSAMFVADGRAELDGKDRWEGPMEGAATECLMFEREEGRDQEKLPSSVVILGV